MADRSSDEHEGVRRVRPVFRPAAAHEGGEHRHRQRPGASTGRTIVARPGCPTSSAIRRFVGKKEQSSEQKAEMLATCSMGTEGRRDARLRDVLVSQGRPTTWRGTRQSMRRSCRPTPSPRANRSASCGASCSARGVKIHFAHRTFPMVERGQGQGGRALRHHRLRRCTTRATSSSSTTTRRTVNRTQCARPSNINPYLVEGSDVLLREAPVSWSAPAVAIGYGSFALDDGHLLHAFRGWTVPTSSPRRAGAHGYLRPLVGGRRLYQR